MKLKISQVWSAINTMRTPKARYHQDPATRISVPRRDATVPKTVKVIALPSEKTTDSQNALRVSRCPVPPTYPITRGTLVSAHGVNAVSMPPTRANSGASHALAIIEDDSHSTH